MVVGSGSSFVVGVGEPVRRSSPYFTKPKQQNDKIGLLGERIVGTGLGLFLEDNEFGLTVYDLVYEGYLRDGEHIDFRFKIPFYEFDIEIEVKNWNGKNYEDSYLKDVSNQFNSRFSDDIIFKVLITFGFEEGRLEPYIDNDIYHINFEKHIKDQHTLIECIEKFSKEIKKEIKRYIGPFSEYYGY
ncbi:hypothetical protein [Methanonatronarchaeum sp. AMET-Sl]|uniref:hypothetical protein n=1 Tax=Methanonatronarchaeum sp. AMET-Sl TaxID=3037654 RepID=UPI00244E1630|nr:hypothetical protein [Methanonatronarchaeum sp. AMET-Sl]WGI17760.1 hypothetical protein QEN48_01775 [Methanonatronarchaeum sp. AMET-Sl]